MKSIIGIACMLLVAGLFLVAIVGPEAFGEDKVETIFSSYGFWTTTDGLETMLFINNPSPADLDLTLGVFDQRGRALLNHHFILSGSQSSNLALSRIVGQGRFGYLRLTFPSETCILPAQALISNGDDGFSLDLHDERDLRGAAPKAHALLPPMTGVTAAARLILTNFGDETQTGVISSSLESRAKNAPRWSLSPGQTVVIEYPFGDRVAKQGSVDGLSLVPDDPAAKVAIHGYLDLDNGGMLPLHFQPALPKSSGEIAGFFSGSDSRVLLWNRSLESTDVEIEMVDSRGRRYSTVRTIDASTAADFPLDDLDGLPKDAEGVIMVRFSDRASLIGQVLGLSGDPTLTTLKDTALETRGSYSLPVRLTPGLNTRIKVFNPGGRTEILCVFVKFGQQAYTHPLKKLAPGQYVDIDLGKAKREHLLGEAGAIIETDAEIGQVKLILHPEPDLPPTKRFVVMGMLEDTRRPRSVTFQGCVSCPDVLTGLEIDPGSFVGVSGSSQTFQVKAFYNEESIKSTTVTTAAFKDSTNYAVATVSSNLLSFHAPGSAQLFAAFTDCTFVQSVNPVGGEGPFSLDCECVEYGSYSALASIAVLPPLPPPPPPSVTIAGFDGVPKNGTTTVQVTVSPSANIELRLTTQTGSGQARFSSNNGTTLQINGTTSVVIKGITESSTRDNIRLEARVQSTVGAAELFSVVWVTLDLRASEGQSPSSDNSRRDVYAASVGQGTLGLFKGSELAEGMWVTGAEIVGTVTPSNYSGTVVLNRSKSTRTYRFCVSTFPQSNNSPDTSSPGIRDDDPQSGGSMGRVYDLDTPGIGMSELEPVGTIWRTRQQFQQWATLDTEQNQNSRASDLMSWWSRVSIVKTAPDDLEILPGMVGDNRAAKGVISLQCQ